ncbi:MAG: hypothetical protein AAGB31_08695 [Bdellovibrio sp.]
MKKLLVLAALGAFSLIAQAQYLGELKGSGSLQATYGRVDGSRDARNATCDVAVNIHDTATEFGLTYSYYNCQALGIWNDFSEVYKIQGSQLLDAKGNVKGSIAEDGTVQFSTTKSSSMQYRLDHLDMDCRLEYSEVKTLVLNEKVTYSIKKQENGAYAITRQFAGDQVAYTSRRQYSHCRAVTVPTKVQNRSVLTATVKK